jgi:hypothetical protein
MKDINQMTDVEKCEAVIAKLAKKHGELSELSAQIDLKRQALALPANTGDADAAKELAEMNRETITIRLDIENLSAAVQAAKLKLDEARRAEVLEERKANAATLRQVNLHFGSLAVEMDEALQKVAAIANDMQDTLFKIHSLGSSAPNHSQLTTLGTTALKSALMQTCFKLEHVAPLERRTYGALFLNWCEMIERGVTALIGPEKTEEAA